MHEIAVYVRGQEGPDRTRVLCAVLVALQSECEALVLDETPIHLLTSVGHENHLELGKFHKFAVILEEDCAEYAP